MSDPVLLLDPREELILRMEKDRRLAPFDNRLKRPRFMPFMARLALKFIGPKKKAAA